MIPTCSLKRILKFKTVKIQCRFATYLQMGQNQNVCTLLSRILYQILTIVFT